MNLFKAELRRIARRRLSLIFGIIAAAGVLVLAGVFWFTSSKGPTAEALEEAQAEADRMNEENYEYEACIEDEAYLEGPDYEWVEDDPYYDGLSHEEACAELFGVWTAEDLIWTYTFDFAEESPLLLIGVAIVAGLVMMMLASSAIGAEWSSGGMANLLLWHPNRMRVWGTKLGAAAAVCAAAVLALMLLAFGLLYLAASVRGDVSGVDAGWWDENLPKFARAAVLSVGMTVLGASLAMLGRHTAISGGIIAGYLIVGDMLVRIAAMALQMPFSERLSLYTWVTAWVDGKTELYDWTDLYAETADVMVITASEAGLLLGGIVLGFAVLATWAFQRRDVS
ncbi:ABC transporter permease subunit [Glycomyces luteolus]|uniref:ABC transporter permease subunit n=1 Tax=Glycomyces luteolus TaxID=2670330 RepID=A0A9X3SR51_9ACTN|nr:ABC transporter permease subunit [Glycomyces luteolus]MDA1358153.1 ABC transporter permease subunit [Glycomyces luteolus]